MSALVVYGDPGINTPNFAMAHMFEYYVFPYYADRGSADRLKGTRRIAPETWDCKGGLIDPYSLQGISLANDPFKLDCPYLFQVERWA